MIKIVMISFLIFFVKSNATILNVGVNKTFSTIQSAINASSNGDSVLVQEGTYNENIIFIGKKILVASIDEIEHINFIQSTIIKGTGASSTVKFINKEDSTSVLKGFAIENGNAQGIDSDTSSGLGGGIFCLNTSPQLNDLILAYNHATYYGGGLYLENSFSKVTNVSIYYNKSNSGGGLMIRGGAPDLENIIVNSDSATMMGAGIFIGYNSNAILNNVDVSYNALDTLPALSNGPGGGIMISQNSNPTLINVNVHNNLAKSGGGIACWYGSQPNFISVKIVNNTLKGKSNLSSNGGGGGLEIWESNVIVKNTLIAKNRALEGGGVFITASNTKFINVTFADNEATIYGKGGAIYKGWGGTMNIINSIMYNNWAPLNSSPTRADNIYDCGNECVQELTPTNINISYSLIENGLNTITDSTALNYDATNINSNPFYNLTTYQLLPNSPCRDAGTIDISSLSLPSTDLGGNPRISNCRIDMGAYEYDTTSNCNTAIKQEISNNNRPVTIQHNINSLIITNPNLLKNTLTIFTISGRTIAHYLFHKKFQEIKIIYTKGFYLYKLENKKETLIEAFIVK